MTQDFYEQANKNKQGTSRVMPFEKSIENMVNDALNVADETYRELLSLGVSREQARMVLPVSTMTSFYMTGNLLNFLKFLKLRLDDHAQYEVWVIAYEIATRISTMSRSIWNIVKEDFYGTEGILAESRNADRAIQEGRISREGWEDLWGAPTYGPEILDPVRVQVGDWSTKG